MSRLILDLCGGTGGWSKPYRDAGYCVKIIDPFYDSAPDRLSKWLEHVKADDFRDVHGVLFAPPCTQFAGSGAQYWQGKDRDGRTRLAINLVRHGLALIQAWNPKWWALENPIGRIARLIPELGNPQLMFDPCDYGDPYTKRTCLWGSFNVPAQSPVEPIRVSSQGSWLMRLGGKSKRTKRLRSATPAGFAKAFFEANQ